MDKEDEEKVLLESVSVFFKSMIAIFVSVATAAIIGMWQMINNLNIQQVKQAADIDKLQDNMNRDKAEINARLTADESQIIAHKNHESK
jgi:cytochrome c556